ncbi:hypothetical protein ABT294_19600 [Nonomuraea sp. NPDC000554]|uniref:hypothetical protein n=1 Tax=Nonomuraea sp. NPDC000554 TaxID=3154259 RepID=UPI0033330C4A
MTGESGGFGYSSGDMHTGGKAVDDTTNLLGKPKVDFENGAQRSKTCFGLVPEGSEKLAKDYDGFYTNTMEWMQALQSNIGSAGLTMVQSKHNYDNAVRPE